MFVVERDAGKPRLMRAGRVEEDFPRLDPRSITSSSSGIEGRKKWKRTKVLILIIFHLHLLSGIYILTVTEHLLAIHLKTEGSKENTYLGETSYTTYIEHSVEETATMSKSRLPLWLGLGVAGAGGYYLYSAGGDPKSATKHFEGK